MSTIAYTVLISSAGSGPYRDRVLNPVSVASLWVGGSARWVFTSLHDGSQGSVRPFGPSDEVAALLIGIAAHLVKDESVLRKWNARASRHGADVPVRADGDRELIEAARVVVDGVCRLSVVGEEVNDRAPQLPQTLGGLRGLDVEVLVPATPAN